MPTAVEIDDSVCLFVTNCDLILHAIADDCFPGAPRT